jgi:hypothetical protein
MMCVMVRNEEESYLYTYLRSGTGTTGEYPPGYYRSQGFQPLQSTYWRFCEEIAYRYYRAFTGTTGQRSVLPVQPPVLPLVQFTTKTSFVGNWPTGTTGLSPVPPVTTGTTSRPPVLPLEQKLTELKHCHRRDLCLPVLPALQGIKHLSKCPWVQRCLSTA